MVWNLLRWSGTHTHNIPWGNSCVINTKVWISLGLPWWLSGKALACQRRRWGFDPWVRKIPEQDNGSPLQYSRLGGSVGPQISFPFTSCVCYYCVATVVPWWGRDVKGIGGDQPQIVPQIFLQPLRWQFRLQLRTAKWSPTKNTGKVTQTQRPPAEPRNAFQGEKQGGRPGVSPEQILPF